MSAASAALGAQAAPPLAAIARFTVPWVIVFQDSAFQIALDTSRVERVGANSYLLWMQTRWLVPRRGSNRRTPSPFNRELIHTFLRCAPVAYKVARTVVSLDDGPPIDSIGGGVAAARQSDWRTSSPGSADAGAGVEACRIVGQTLVINPATASVATLLRTRGPPWRSARSAHFILRVEQSPHSASSPVMLDSLERAWQSAIGLLGSPDVAGIQAHVFITASRTRFSGLVAPDAKGLTTQLPVAGEIVILVRNDSVRAYVQHEVMHVAAAKAWGPSAPGMAWLAEGLATFADGRCQASSIRAVGRDLLEARQEISAEDVIDHFSDLWRTERAASYVLAGTLVDYLWATRGRSGVRRLWQRQDSITDTAIVPGARGALSAEWRAYIRRVSGQEPGIDLASLERRGCG